MSQHWDPENLAHTELRSKMRAAGPAIVALGLLFMGVGLISIFSAMGDGGPPRQFWCMFVGMPLLGVGMSICKFAYMGAVTRYMAGEVAPVGKDVVKYMVDGTKDSIRDVAAAVADGMHSADVDQEEFDEAPPVHVKVRCRKCRALNDEMAKFCNQCAAEI